MAIVNDNRLGAQMNIECRKGESFSRQYHAEFYSGCTLYNYDFSDFIGAKMEVRKKAGSPIAELTLSTDDNTITLGQEGRFVLELSYEIMNGIRSGEYIYDMYLIGTTSDKERRDFLFGKFNVFNKITT